LIELKLITRAVFYTKTNVHVVQYQQRDTYLQIFKGT